MYQSFMIIFNTQHTNIKFTFEIQQNDTLPFVDVLVKISGNTFVADFYRKPTFAGLCMEHDSLIDHGVQNLYC